MQMKFLLARTSYTSISHGTRQDRIVPAEAKTLESMGIEHHWLPNTCRGHALSSTVDKVDIIVNFMRNKIDGVEFLDMCSNRVHTSL